MARLGPLLGAKETGISVYELPPGQAVCPYHYECGEEEWLLVLERHADPAHAGRARSGSRPGTSPASRAARRAPTGSATRPRSTARVLMFSTVVLPTATVYPDSDKVGIWVGDPEVDMTVAPLRRRSTTTTARPERPISSRRPSVP